MVVPRQKPSEIRKQVGEYIAFRLNVERENWERSRRAQGVDPRGFVVHVARKTGITHVQLSNVLAGKAGASSEDFQDAMVRYWGIDGGDRELQRLAAEWAAGRNVVAERIADLRQTVLGLEQNAATARVLGELTIFEAQLHADPGATTHPNAEPSSTSTPAGTGATRKGAP